jgi:hypothetical protein
MQVPSLSSSLVPINTNAISSTPETPFPAHVIIEIFQNFNDYEDRVSLSVVCKNWNLLMRKQNHSEILEVSEKTYKTSKIISDAVWDPENLDVKIISEEDSISPPPFFTPSRKINFPLFSCNVEFKHSSTSENDNYLSSLKHHEFDFSNDEVFSYNSFFCAFNRRENEIRFFCITESMSLQQQSKVVKISDYISGIIHSEKIAINEKYLLCQCISSKKVSRVYTPHSSRIYTFILFDNKGNFIERIRETVDFPAKCLDSRQSAAQLYDDYLIYYTPRSAQIKFWHIPTNLLIRKLDYLSSLSWRYKISGLAIEDIHFCHGKITLLFANFLHQKDRFPKELFLVQLGPFEDSLMNKITSVVKYIFYLNQR